MSRQVVVTVLYRESGSGCDETPVRSGGGVPQDDAGFNAFEFRLVSSLSLRKISPRPPPAISPFRRADEWNQSGLLCTKKGFEQPTLRTDIKLVDERQGERETKRATLGERQSHCCELSPLLRGVDYEQYRPLYVKTTSAQQTSKPSNRSWPQHCFCPARFDTYECLLGKGPQPQRAVSTLFLQ